MIHRYIIVCTILFLCGWAISCTKDNPISTTIETPKPVVGKTYSADEILGFKQLTINATNNQMIKWPRHASFFLVDTGYAYMTEEIDSILREINSLLDTNLVLTRTNNRASSNIQIYLTNRSTYIAAEPAVRSSLENSNYTGMANLNWGNNGVLIRGSVFVDMERTLGNTFSQRYIIHHEIMHALGFYGHVTQQGINSMMLLYPQNTMTKFSPFDKRMMLLLYNPAIQAGMNEEAFNSVVKNI
jgi:Protein of unknown function (DUF2927)